MDPPARSGSPRPGRPPEHRSRRATRRRGRRSARSDDRHEAVLDELLAAVFASDPVAAENGRERFPSIAYCETLAAALENAAAALIVTERDEIAAFDEEFDAMETPIVIDGRHPIERRDGLVYEGLTWYPSHRHRRTARQPRED